MRAELCCPFSAHGSTVSVPILFAAMTGIRLQYDKAKTDRVCYLIGHHHTYDQIDGIDYQILVEADFLVNLAEEQSSRETIESVKGKIFKTKTGIWLINKIF